MTTQTLIDDQADGRGDKFASYLLKPYTSSALHGQVRALRWRALRLGALTTQVGDRMIDLVSHAVTSEGKPVHRSAREYAVLKLLACHPNGVMTRRQIAEDVCGSDIVAWSNVVDPHVSDLWRKLGDRVAQRLFHSVRSVGYQLRVRRT